MLATMLRHKIMYLINFILKPIQTICFDPIIYLTSGVSSVREDGLFCTCSWCAPSEAHEPPKVVKERSTQF